MKVLLTGCSGFVGQNIAAALRSAGQQIVPISRSHGIDFNQMLSPEKWLPHLDGVDAVINCVGIIAETKNQNFEILHALAPMALFQACKQAGVNRVIQVSALGADEDAFSQYHLSKCKADEFLRGLDLDWLVLRSSMIYGKGGESAASFMRMAALPIIPVIGGGHQLLQPIHVQDVAETVLEALTTSATKQTLDVVGSEVISFTDWLQCMRRAQDLSKGRVCHIPVPLVAAFFKWGQYFSPLLQPDNLRMLQASYQADTQPLTSLLGRAPMLIQDELFYSSLVTEEK